MIRQILLCTIGSVFFAVTMRVSPKSLVFVFIGAGISSTVSIVFYDKYKDFIPCVLSMLILTLYCEICARILKQPVTITLLPSTIPLLPGSYIYYSMLCAVNSNISGFIENAKATIYTGLGITVGAILGGLLTQMINALYHHDSIHKILLQMKETRRQRRDD